MPCACEPDAPILDQRANRTEWVERIGQAIAEGRFRLWSQEIRSLGSGLAPGRSAEALLRLEEGGRLFSPAAFVPAAEACHLMPALDRWVVEAGIGWLAGNPGALDRLSINLSGQSLADRGFLGHVFAVLEATGVVPARVCFEITETAAIADMAEAARSVAALRERGCRFALDDFGSGLSSFAYLKRLRFDVLKIDGSFVRGLTRDPTDRALVEGIHRIGRVLGMETVAESVEDEPTLDALRAMGVEYAQGFAIARPRPLAEARAPRP